MTPSGPVLLLPLERDTGEDADSLADSSVDSVSEGELGESYPWMGLGGMGDGSPQRRNSKFEAEGVIMVTS